MSLVHSRCEFAVYKVIRIQQTAHTVFDGRMPHTASLSVYDNLIDVSKPAGPLVATGISRGRLTESMRYKQDGGSERLRFLRSPCNVTMRS